MVATAIISAMLQNLHLKMDNRLVKVNNLLAKSKIVSDYDQEIRQSQTAHTHP